MGTAQVPFCLPRTELRSCAAFVCCCCGLPHKLPWGVHGRCVARFRAVKVFCRTLAPSSAALIALASAFKCFPAAMVLDLCAGAISPRADLQVAGQLCMGKAFVGLQVLRLLLTTAVTDRTVASGLRQPHVVGLESSKAVPNISDARYQ